MSEFRVADVVAGFPGDRTGVAPFDRDGDDAEDPLDLPLGFAKRPFVTTAVGAVDFAIELGDPFLEDLPQRCCLFLAEIDLHGPFSRPRYSAFRARKITRGAPASIWRVPQVGAVQW